MEARLRPVYMGPTGKFDDADFIVFFFHITCEDCFNILMLINRQFIECNRTIIITTLMKWIRVQSPAIFPSAVSFAFETVATHCSLVHCTSKAAHHIRDSLMLSSVYSIRSSVYAIQSRKIQISQ